MDILLIVVGLTVMVVSLWPRRRSRVYRVVEHRRTVRWVRFGDVEAAQIDEAVFIHDITGDRATTRALTEGENHERS